MRATFVSGFPRKDAELNGQADEIVWVDSFKYQHTYKILAGWRLWDNATSTEPSEGKDVVNPWKFEVDCGDYACIGSGAVTMGASALALAATLLAF